MEDSYYFRYLILAALLYSHTLLVYVSMLLHDSFQQRDGDLNLHTYRALSSNSELGRDSDVCNGGLSGE